jgi:hypothetical protein
MRVIKGIAFHILVIRELIEALLIEIINLFVLSWTRVR